MTHKYFNFYMIPDAGSFLRSPWVQGYPFQLLLWQQFAAQSSVDRARMIWIAQSTRDRVQCRILDNGAHEDLQCPAGDYLMLALAVKPDILVLPDTVGDENTKSRERSLSFVDKLNLNGYKGRFMYAAQGASYGQVLEEYAWALDNLDPVQFVIGFGQSYLTLVKDVGDKDKERTRLPLIDRVLNHPNSRWFEFHILGGRWHPVNIGHRYPSSKILGVDSIKPFKCAAGLTMYPQQGTTWLKPEDQREDQIPLGQVYLNMAAFGDAYGLNVYSTW